MNLYDYFQQEGRGVATRVAKSIGAHVPDVSDWANGNRPIPIKFGAPIELATNKAVTRQEMFPEDWKQIWPELIGIDGSPATTPQPEGVANV